jgi:hypothetical protein
MIIQYLVKAIKKKFGKFKLIEMMMNIDSNMSSSNWLVLDQIQKGGAFFLNFS